MTQSTSLADARTRVSSYLLDDPNQVRWAQTEVDSALKYAVSACLMAYATAGGRRFALEVEKTSTSSGVLSMATEDPLVIHAIMLNVNGWRERVRQIEHSEREVNDDTARTLSVLYTPQPPFPSNSAHPLIGDGATAYPTFPAFDEWVMRVASLNLLPKDDVNVAGMTAERDRFEALCMMGIETPSTVDFPRDNRRYPYLSWSYIGQSVQVSRTVWGVAW